MTALLGRSFSHYSLLLDHRAAAAMQTSQVQFSLPSAPADPAAAEAVAGRSGNTHGQTLTLLNAA